MKYFFVILLLFIVTVVSAQQEVEEYNNKALNSKVLNNNTVKEVSVEEEVIETIPVVAREVKGSTLQNLNYLNNKFQNIYSRSNVSNTSKSPTKAEQLEMDTYVKSLEIADKNSLQYNLAKYKSCNFDTKKIKYLIKAESLENNNTEVILEMYAYNYIVDGNDRLKYEEKIKSFKILNKNLFSYAKEVLNCLPKNATLITHGKEDSYPAFIENANKSVTIINLDFLQSATYRSKLKTKGYKLPKSTTIDVNYLKTFCALNADKNLNISLTLPKQYLKAMAGKLYVNGLTYSYSNIRKETFATNEYLLNKLDVLTDVRTVINYKKLSANYLPMLLEVRTGWKQLGDLKGVKKIEKKILEIGIQIGKEKQIKALLKQ